MIKEIKAGDLVRHKTDTTSGFKMVVESIDGDEDGVKEAFCSYLIDGRQEKDTFSINALEHIPERKIGGSIKLSTL